MKRITMVLVAILLLTGCSSANSNPFLWENDIHVVSREDGSGTRGAFTELLKITEKNSDGVFYDYTTLEASITNSTSVVMTSVSGDNHAIGYLSLGSLNDTVKAVSINNVAPTAENIKANLYPVARPFLIMTKGEQSKMTEDFIRFILSQQGQAIVEEYGYVSVREGEVYQPSYLTGNVVVGGSSSVTPIIEKLKEAYLLVQPDITVEVQQSDSTTGVSSVNNGIYDIGMSSRPLKETEKAFGLNDLTIAMDGIVVIVNNDTPIDNLTTEQVKNIFTGKYLKWEEVREGNND